LVPLVLLCDTEASHLIHVVNAMISYPQHHQNFVV
jgi:hypothetical protein